ncbi:MAG: hypothetical protein H0X46_09865 [Bacteroidetes bacterium]|nr:hypothetical protein [Bacteroidota bacterium]
MSKFVRFLLLLLTFHATMLSAQEAEDVEVTDQNGKRSPFKVGLYIGSYFANKYTAGVYDGYGFDLDGKRNTVFENSYMYEKIINQYGGGYGQTDQIAIALGVNHTDWSFNSNDMPVNMRYTPAFLLGLQCRYSVDEKNAISINLNASKLSISGNFTISTIPASGSSQMNNSIKTFGIRGGEQRLMIQIGYNRIFGDNEKANFFAEAGMNITYSQFDKNEILINDLMIDLLGFYDFQGIQAGYGRKPRGMGYGVYAGAGLNITMSEQFTIQLIYSPSYEGINIGDNPKLKWQHSLGLRAYYNF